MNKHLKNSLWLLLALLLNQSVLAATTLTISDEASGNNATGRAAAATLDDSWAASFPEGVVQTDIFAGTNGYAESSNFTDANGFNYLVNWQLGYINTSGPGTPVSTDFIDVNSGGSVTQGVSNAIQAGAPNPFSTTISRISTGLPANGGLNAIRFDFSNSLTPIQDFGVFIGDTESRLNYGTAGRVIVFDLIGNVLLDNPIVYTGTVLNGTNYGPVVEPLATPGFPTGPNNNPANKWGNRTTAFISVKSDQPIGQVYIHVGDDDHTSSNNGISEQLGVVGFQVANYKPEAKPVPLLSKTGLALLIFLFLMLYHALANKRAGNNRFDL